jgi:ubiquinone/menaquinone biosynthesis C-methylase UbiE
VADDPRIHPRATAFSSAATVYDQARPPFPQAAIDWLAEQLRIGPGSRVLDLAAGTGRLTAPLAGLTTHLVAVEPVAEMRGVLTRALPGVEVLDGVAEEIPLATSAVDAITVAQAFHWFDPEPAFSEMARVLRPGGMLGLAWHAPDLDDPRQARFRALIERYRGDQPYYARATTMEAFEHQDLFATAAHTSIRDVHRYDGEALANLALSTSHVAILTGAAREEILTEARASAGGGEVELAYTVELTALRRR